MFIKITDEIFLEQNQFSFKVVKCPLVSYRINSIIDAVTELQKLSNERAINYKFQEKNKNEPSYSF